MQITEIRYTEIGTFTIVHEIKERKAWRVPLQPNGKNAAGGRKAHLPKVEPKTARPPRGTLAEGNKFYKALKLRAELVRAIARR